MAAGASMRLNVRQKGVCGSYWVPELGKLGTVFGSWERKLC